MAQSPEFPQYKWVPPKSWTNGRKSGQPTVIVIHTTEGSEGPNSAEDGAAYDQRRTDGTSAHFYVDSDSIVQCVETTDEAHTARQTGNDIGIHLELCGKAGQSASQWADPVSSATVENAAEVCRTLLGKYPNIPIVRLTPAQLRAGERGFCGHVDISNAFGESDHTDPGPNFPWARLFDLIEEEEMDQPTFDQRMIACFRDNGTFKSLFRAEVVSYAPVADNKSVLNTHRDTYANAGRIPGLEAKIDAIAAKVDIDAEELAAIEQAAYEGAQAGAADVQAIVDGVLAGLNTAGLSDEQIADVETAVRSVFADAGAADTASGQ